MIAAWLAAPEAQAQALLFASLRIGAALAVVPGIGAMLFPLRARIGLSTAIGTLVLAGPPLAVPPDLLGASGLLMMAGEITIGLLAGLALHLAYAAASMAGELLSQAMGLGFAAIIDPGGGSNPVLSSFMGLLLWLVLLGTGAHLQLIALIVQSYAVLPPGGDPFAHAGELPGFAGEAFAAALMLALPISGVLLLVNLLLAVTARSAPQLNIFSVGFPVLAGTGLLLLPLALPSLLADLGGIVAGLGAQWTALLAG